ncbi:tRNA preQ1(34) S-adenosylmethionine ribosyltransferase-isomerase QueA [Faunimonas sp. B44]|uniref:tRNA preQ1(34) S-adenosylmethionine ribosyltransferase-isomerase QueA n=1 Tax=Faunimonas sp. B44 TaxID=3461493 RepID=UPI004044B290
MRLEDFDFELPEGLIALRPARPRDAARMLVVEPGVGLRDRIVRDLPGLLRPGDVLVFNDTRVISAQLSGTRHRDGAPSVAVGMTLAERVDDATWMAFARPGRRLAPGDVVRIGHDSNLCMLGTLEARVEAKEPDGRVRLLFSLSGAALDEAVALVGAPPLPPYIAARRTADEADRTDYQTVYARREGAVAAPTAGLHFTPGLFAALADKGIATEYVTLHVGPGTFLPVKIEDVSGHRMHAEVGEISADAAGRLNAARAAGGRIVAIGTTSLRLLESAAGDDGLVRPFTGATDIFITPGHRFRAVDLLMTNFHLPKSTLFMLVAAFSGLETMRAAYAHAVERGYRFYSYGDACLLFPEGPR